MQKVSVVVGCLAQSGGGLFAYGLELGDVFGKLGIVGHGVDVE